MMVRRMAFNVLVGNKDDHSKNFSFVMDAEGGWHLAPAYDLTRCRGMSGEHCAAVNGKGKGITTEDMVAAAAAGGVSRRRARRIVEEVRDAVAGERPDDGDQAS